MNKHIEDNPNLKNDFRLAEKTAKQWAEELNKTKTSNVVSIPTVFHVIHNTTLPEQNVPDSVLLSQLEVLNDDYRRTNADKVNTRPVFDSIAADVEIEFCLATLDPSGNATTGIQRIQTNETGFDIFSSMDDMKYTSTGGADVWPTDKYLNIWVCNMTIFGQSGSLLGFAQFPGDDPATDGVVIQYNYVGNTTDPNQTIESKGRTATHEVGHWLGLRHIWADDGTILGGGACDSSDFVDDTPNQEGQSNYDCNLTINSCSNEAAFWGNTDPPDMVENYMDYSSDDCSNLFTEGQKSRMLSFLNTDRIGLITSEKCGTPPVGMDNQSKLNLIVIAPNPASDIIELTNNSTSRLDYIQVINGMGQLVQWAETHIEPNTSTTIKLQKHNTGLYWIIAQSKSGSQTKKILIDNR